MIVTPEVVVSSIWECESVFASNKDLLNGVFLEAADFLYSTRVLSSISVNHIWDHAFPKGYSKLTLSAHAPGVNFSFRWNCDRKAISTAYLSHMNVQYGFLISWMSLWKEAYLNRLLCKVELLPGKRVKVIGHSSILIDTKLTVKIWAQCKYSVRFCQE